MSKPNLVRVWQRLDITDDNECRCSRSELRDGLRGNETVSDYKIRTPYRVLTLETAAASTLSSAANVLSIEAVAFEKI